MAAYKRAKQWGKKRKSYKGRSTPQYARKIYASVVRKAKKILNRTRKI